MDFDDACQYVCDRNHSPCEGSGWLSGRDPPDGAGLLFPKTPPVANHPDVARLWYLKAGMKQIIGLSTICRPALKRVLLTAAHLRTIAKLLRNEPGLNSFFGNDDLTGHFDSFLHR